MPGMPNRQVQARTGLRAVPRVPSAQQGLLPWQCGVQVLERVLSEPQRPAGKCLHQTSHHPEPDCRFWSEPKQSRASLILQTEKDREGSVFYFWSQERQECFPCTVCPERTLSHCSYVRDTVCVSQSEWLHRGLQTTSSGLDLLESRLRGSEQGNRDEGVVRL